MPQSIYQKQLDELLCKLNPNESPKPSLLLHACCGPCSSYVLEYLASIFDITVLYYNPNIYPQTEYERRLNELKAFYTKFPPVLQNAVHVVECSYNPQEFYDAVDTKNQPELAVEKERGERCRRCYEFRLRKTFEYACEHHFDYFCTTLSISPFKDAEKINTIGRELEKTFAGQNACAVTDACELQNASSLPKWLPSDFKKKNGFKRSLELSAEYGLYRQDYCGCVYSMRGKENTSDL